jgi:hypothetical protein
MIRILERRRGSADIAYAHERCLDFGRDLTLYTSCGEVWKNRLFLHTYTPRFPMM